MKRHYRRICNLEEESDDDRDTNDACDEEASEEDDVHEDNGAGYGENFQYDQGLEEEQDGNKDTWENEYSERNYVQFRTLF